MDSWTSICTHFISSFVLIKKGFIIFNVCRYVLHNWFQPTPIYENFNNLVTQVFVFLFGNYFIYLFEPQPLPIGHDRCGCGTGDKTTFLLPKKP